MSIRTRHGRDVRIIRPGILKTMINILRTLTDKVYRMQEQMGKVSGEMEILRKNQKRKLEMKNTLKEIKLVFYGLITRLDTAEERITEVEDIINVASKSTE